ncbi:MAG: class I SAM-dependent methyltransferase [Patescibacteria group bacterium]
MQTTDNFRKHTSKNPVQKFLIGNFEKTIANQIQKLDVSSILDAGCGEGFTLEYLRVRNIGKTYEGVDFLQKAVEIGTKIHPNITLRKESVYEMPYKDNSFDLVLSTEVLEHLEEPQKALKEIFRVSKKYVLLSVPNEPIFIASNFLRGKNWSRFGNDIEHINHWTFFGFEKFVKENLPAGRQDAGVNIKIVSRKHPFPWTMLVLEKIS